MQRQYGSHEERGRFPTTFVAIAAVVLAVVVVLVLVLSYFSSSSSYYGYPYGGGWSGGTVGGTMLIIVPIVIVVLVIIGWVVYRGFGWGGGYGDHCDGHYSHRGSEEERETATEILRRRYAKGEITKEQFEQMKKDLLG